MREGRPLERGWKNILKMKIWIRSIEVIVGLVFLTGLIVALFKAKINYINPHKEASRSQTESTSGATKQSSANINSSPNSTPGAK
jgi:hypothetical protein